MRILLLGGTGAMGIHLVNILSSKTANEVWVTSRSNGDSQKKNVIYVKGNARDDCFLYPLIENQKFDVIEDFMTYRFEQLANRLPILLAATKQYVFLSSARVFSSVELPIKESSPRLLEVCHDEEYLATEEYSLAKAREEDLFKNQTSRNYTIVRPYITYSENRLQLGVLEKEDWLYRTLKGRSIVFSRDIAEKFTTLTYGYDVSSAIEKLIGNDRAVGESINVMHTEAVKWGEILSLYVTLLAELTGKTPRVVMTDTAINLHYPDRKWQVLYDRCLDRKFNTEKLMSIIGQHQFVDIKTGLKMALEGFLKHPSYRNIDWKAEAIRDKMSGDVASIMEIPGKKMKLKYLYWRFLCKTENLYNL
jgi:nucleoside-diphosphate-sugar epimerase